MTALFVDEYPAEARLVKAAFLSSFIAFGIGALFGIIQALHRTDIFRFLESAKYYTVLTGHGVFLVIAFTIFFLVGLYQWAVTDSLERGPVDIRFTWLWYGLMAIGSFLAAISILAGFLEQPPMVLGSELRANVLFTFYAPLQANPLYYIGLALFLVGTWLAGIDWFRTWWAWRDENPGERIPLRAFMVLTTMIMFFLGSVGVIVSVLVFILPWSLEITESLNPLLT